MTIRRSNMEKQVSKSGSKKDACYHKVKARYRDFPSRMPLVPLQNVERLEQPTTESPRRKKLWVEPQRQISQELCQGFKNGGNIIIAEAVVWSRARREENCVGIMAVRKIKKGLALKRWFKEDWKDVRAVKMWQTKGRKRGTPYCRPSKRIIKKTPKTVSRCQPLKEETDSSEKKTWSTCG